MRYRTRNGGYAAYFGALPTPIAGEYLEIPSMRAELLTVQCVGSF